MLVKRHGFKFYQSHGVFRGPDLLLHGVGGAIGPVARLELHLYPVLLVTSVLVFLLKPLPWMQENPHRGLMVIFSVVGMPILCGFAACGTEILTKITISCISSLYMINFQKVGAKISHRFLKKLPFSNICLDFSTSNHCVTRYMVTIYSPVITLVFSWYWSKLLFWSATEIRFNYLNPLAETVLFAACCGLTPVVV